MPSLSPDFEEVIQNYRDAFEDLQELDEKECGVSETLKVTLLVIISVSISKSKGSPWLQLMMRLLRQVIRLWPREIRLNKRMTRNLTGPLKSLVNILQKSITYARGRIINFVCSGMILRKISVRLSRSWEKKKTSLMWQLLVKKTKSRLTNSYLQLAPLSLGKMIMSSVFTLFPSFSEPYFIGSRIIIYYCTCICEIDIIRCS